MIKIEKQINLAHQAKIETMPLPQTVYIPLIQHLGAPAQPEVAVGDAVRTGQRIGRADAHVTAVVHASISGRVVAIREWPHPVIGQAMAIVIESDGLDLHAVSCNPCQTEQISQLGPADIRRIIFEAGIVGMGGAGFPTHIKLDPPKPVDTLIINGAECEPYLAADNRLMVEKAGEILLGAKLVEKCLSVKRVIIAVEDNKAEAIAVLRRELKRSSEAGYSVYVLKSGYPQGGEKQLIKNIVGREVPQGKLPFEAGVVVHNVATVNAVYEAAYLGKPLYERVVTVAGTCLKDPKNLLVRIGTPIKELIAYCGQLIEEPAKIVIGGPMMGVAQSTTDVPVTKTANGVVLFNKKEARLFEEQVCVRCGACVRECPAGLMPCLINLASQKGKWQMAKGYNALDCIECGVCNYVCPAHRALTQSIKRAKMEAGK